MPEGKSAIWCGSINLAWKELNQLAGGDVALPGLPQLTEQLNRASKQNVGLEPSHFYAKAGRTSEGIYEVIRKELAVKFPKAKPPERESSEEGIIAFAYLELVSKFQQEFLDDEEGAQFRDGRGQKTRVKAFGIRVVEKDIKRLGCRDQIQPLYHDGKGHYAVDLCNTMKPYQIIVACVDRGAMLASALADFEKRAAEKRKSRKELLPFSDTAILTVPNMDWEIIHDFQEMVGQPITGPQLLEGIVVTKSQQMIRLKLDRTGAALTSGYRLDAALNGLEVHPAGHFIFDQPYLLIMRRRDQAQPFFVMWVENAELLQRK